MQGSAAMKERGAVRDPETMRDPGAGAAAAPVGGTRRGPARRSVAMAAAAARGALAGILRRWAPRALPLCGPSARCVGHGPAPASASLWTPRLLGENRPRAGTPSVLSSVTPLLPSLLQQPARTLTYCSLRKGKRKSVKSVVKRFLRLHNGLWVRRKCGYKKKLWKKSAAQKKRLREFVLCTRTQCKLLDKMTTSFWKRRNWYIDDPYQKYHDRTNLRV